MKKRTPFILSCVLSLIIIGNIAPIYAAAILIDEKPAVLKSRTAPKPGLSMKRVFQRYGKPLAKRKSIGLITKKNPLITIWQYPRYRVYFENSRVIHTVIPLR